MKRVLITGGSAGIGKETAKALLQQGFHVTIVGRSHDKNARVVEDLKQSTGSKAIDAIAADLSVQSEVHRLADQIERQFLSLDVLVNNAGAFYTDYQETIDGIERQWATNHLAPFLLTGRLIPLLRKAPQARIVTVSSALHFRGKINFEDLNHKNNYEGVFKAYAQSKLANVFFAYELARREEKNGITSNCLHPGGVATDIGMSHAKGFYYWFWRVFKPFMISVADGAKTSVYLAASSEVEGITGRYFDQCKPKRSLAITYDEQIAQRLWTVSESMTKFKYPD